MHMTRRLLMRFKPANLVCFATCPDFHVWEWRGRGQDYGQLPVFNVKHIANDIRVVMNEGTLLPDFSSWAETKPMILEEESIYKHPLFMDREASVGQELIVDPDEVQSLLERIKKIQAPEQSDIRKRRSKEVPMAKATILAFAA